MRLSEFPWVVVRLDCKLCPRRGQYRLARLAAKLGPEMELEAVLEEVAVDCPWMRRGMRVRQYDPRCGIRFSDLDGRSHPPPDLPPAMMPLRVVSQDGEVHDVKQFSSGRRRR